MGTEIRARLGAIEMRVAETMNLSSVLQAHIAQSVEHFLGKEEVTGSNPVMGSNSRHMHIIDAKFVNLFLFV